MWRHESARLSKIYRLPCWHEVTAAVWPARMLAATVNPLRGASFTRAARIRRGKDDHDMKPGVSQCSARQPCRTITRHWGIHLTGEALVTRIGPPQRPTSDQERCRTSALALRLTESPGPGK